MKEKVKDLDPVLQSAIHLSFSAIDNDDAERWLSIIDWASRSNEERLKYAELMYPVGTKFVSTFGVECIRKEGDAIYETNDGCIYVDIKPNNREVYNAELNAWAKIISRPDEKEETKEPEFQPGGDY